MAGQTAGSPRGLTAPQGSAGRVAFFVSDRTGITAETLGNALLSNFPSIRFERHTARFVDTPAAARMLVAEIETAAASADAPPLVFATVKRGDVRSILTSASAVVIDLLGSHLHELEEVLDSTASEHPGQFHSVGELHAYLERMRAVEYAIEHDDGQSTRGLGDADVILLAPSRCGKTPLTLFLALQYGLRVANYPLTDDDAPVQGLPPILAAHARRCFGLTTTASRLHLVRSQRRPGSQYASLTQCETEVGHAQSLYRASGIPFVSSATNSVEEMAAVIMHTMKLPDSTFGERRT